MTDILQNHYSQVKNPNPVFTPREGKKTLPFCRKLMAKAEGFTSRFDFSIHVAFLRSLGKRHRMPPIPTDITFTPALFSALDVSEVAVVAARRSRVEWENLQRKKQKLKPLEMDELIAKAWRFVRERFRSYQAERKSHGRKRDTARRDASRQRHDIETRVRQQLTREYATGRFRGDKEALKREVERRVQERMLLSRGNNYTRLATAPL
ncbi:plasmid replication initiator RepA [Klebsiella pneumoniae]